MESNVNQFETAEFQILSTKEAFRILSCGLYSNKPAAVLRELGTNAIDAHKEAGTLNKPFEVHIPTYDKPNFKIRDYGTGLKHEDIMNLYRSYFGTNKLENQEATGCLGLGSKSPLCMTDSFTVNSYVGGKKRTYVVEYGEDGIPRINSINGEQVVNEPNGLEISFPVKQYDTYDFQREAKEIYKYFETKPILKGYFANSNVDLSYKVVEKGSCWELTDNGKFRVIMGNVCYPINAEKLNRYLSLTDNFVLSIPVIVKLKNKEVDIVPSREALAYTRKTVDVLKSYIDTIHKEIIEVIQKAVDNSKDIIEARHNLINLAYSKYRIGNLELLYNGKKISCKKVYNFPSNVEAQKIYYGYGRRGSSQTPKCKRETSINYENKAILVEKDIDKGHIKTAYEHVEQNPQTEIYIFDFENNDLLRKQVLEDLGLDEIKKFTEVFTLSTTKRQSNYTPKIGNASKWMYNNRQRYGSHTYNQKDSKIELDKESGYYVPYVDKLCKLTIDGAQPPHNGPYNLDSLKLLMGYINELDKTVPQYLYLVNSWHLKKFYNHKNWQNFSVYINELLKKWESTDGIHNDFVNINYKQCWAYFGECKINIQDEDIKDLISVCYNKDILINLRQHLTKLRNYLGIPQKLEYEKIKDKETKILEKYPLLREIFNHNRYYFTLDKAVVKHLEWYLNNYA